MVEGGEVSATHTGQMDKRRLKRHMMRDRKAWLTEENEKCFHALDKQRRYRIKRKNQARGVRRRGRATKNVSKRKSHKRRGEFPKKKEWKGGGEMKRVDHRNEGSRFCITQESRVKKEKYV